MTNLGGWFMYLAMKQQEAERDADWREMEAETAAEIGRYADELAADERHQELLEAMWATAPKPPEPQKEPAAPYLGPRIDVAGVGLRDLSASPLPASAEALRDEIQPLNLAVGGGSEDAGWAVAQAVQGLLGGQLVGLRLGGLRTPDLAAVLTSLQAEDVLVIPTIEDASGEAVGALRSVLGSGFRDWQVSNDPVEEERLVATGLTSEEASTRVGTHREMDPGRRMNVTDREGGVGAQPDPGPQAVRHRGSHGIGPDPGTAGRLGWSPAPAQGHQDLSRLRRGGEGRRPDLPLLPVRVRHAARAAALGRPAVPLTPPTGTCAAARRSRRSRR